MYTQNGRRITPLREHSRQTVVVSLNKATVPIQDHRNREQELETLMAAISLAAVLLTLLTSLAMKLWLG